MDTEYIQKQDCFWNDKPAKYVVFNYQPSKVEDTPAHWQNSLDDTVRQGLHIFTKGQDFYIDNEFGDGYLKITEGRGCPPYSHSSIENPLNLQYDKFANLKYMMDRVSKTKEQHKHDDWVKEHYPKIAERVRLLRAYFEENRLI